MSIGAVKGFEIGDGFAAAKALGSQNNDEFYVDAYGKVNKKTNHAGGILGGMSDGSQIVLRAAFKPTPSIAQLQKTANNHGENVEIAIKGRHDPVVVPKMCIRDRGNAVALMVDDSQMLIIREDGNILWILTADRQTAQHVQKAGFLITAVDGYALILSLIHI